MSGVSTESVLERYGAVEKREYQMDTIRECVEAINEKQDVHIDLPTGTGKTFVFAPIAIEFAESGLRVAVLSPTKYMQQKILKDFENFPGGKLAEVVYGKTEYHCPKLSASVDDWFCHEKKDTECREEKIICDVIKAQETMEKGNLVLTNYSKFLSTHLEKGFDMIIMDDSHSFEAIKEQAYQRTVLYRLLQRLYERYAADNVLKTFLGTLLDIFDDAFERAIPPESHSGPLGEDYVKQIAETSIPQNEAEILIEHIKVVNDTKDKRILRDAYWFVNACKKSTQFNFYISKDWYDENERSMAQLIARQSDQVQMFRMRKRFGSARVLFATATPVDIIAHASFCTQRNPDDLSLSVVPGEKPEIVKHWFDNLVIYLTSGIGDTREEESMNRAIDLTFNILSNFDIKTLLLFKNYRDQNRVYERLGGKFSHLFFVEEDQDEDEIRELVNRARIILASASSRLWEGIDIDGLRLAIIYSLPYIRPPVHLTGNKGFAYNSRVMLMRLQQGIGRIVRKEMDYGACVLMDNRFKKPVGQKGFSPELRERTIEVESSDLVAELASQFGEWRE